jgi:laccase
MAVIANQPPDPDPQIPVFVSRGIVQYTDIPRADADRCRDQPPQMPEMPDQHDTMTTFYFHGNLSGLPTHPLLPQLRGRVDDHLFISLGKGTICRGDRTSCKRGGSDEGIEVAYMNNVSFRLPEKMSLLEARQYGANDMAVQELPTRPPSVFNFTDPALIPVGPGKPLEKIEATRKATTVRRFKHNATVEVVFQSTATMQSDSNPMHLHGHDFFVLAQGHGNYHPAKHVRTYNLVDPLLKNTVQVPRLGWAVVRFVADNPGAWFMHCHFEFHIAMGMATVFEVANGATPEDTLPPPPSDLPKCIHKKE